MLRLTLLLCLGSLLSAALVAMTVTRSLELVAAIEQAFENPQRRGTAADICVTAMKVCVAFVICGALTFRLARQLPFSP
ncbi:MAG: hypothetical protein GEV05_09510 [Betaproteobacteria bacterium]|nr:hypothetical protein [Betaproteobacteria bacterium]